ncbi:MAG: hypothetical protein KDD38_09455 [Bdellovibrionales bacterium]|nr:hypothetical protein [Bdellovibrionales bacterium]
MAIKIKILKSLLLIILSVGTVSVYALSAFAAPAVKSKKTAKRKDAGQSAVIKVDGSAVYEVPNFDSPVLEYMDRGKQVKISKKIYPGIGGLGAFYKIRIKKGFYGYIADTDAEVSRKGKSSRDGSDDDEDDDENLESETDPTKLQSGLFSENVQEEGADTFYLTRYIGFAYSSFNYSEVLRNQVETSPVKMLGMKMSGPTGIMGGMPLDMNVLFTTTAPNFYSDISDATSGFMLISDALVVLPLYESQRVILYYGFGAMLRYSSWQVKLKSQPGKAAIDSQELGLGAAVTGGAALRLGARLVLRADARYYYEKEPYLGYGAALQFKY